MILGAGLNLGYTFLSGVIATVNPCGFVLLPTYLMYFLGMEGSRPGSQRAAISRALVVSGAVAAGFFAVFLVIGVLYKAGIDWFLEESQWIGFGVGVLMLALGIAMIFGFRLNVGMPKMGVGGKDRTVRSMFLYGVSYAVASIGCTLPLFISAVLNSVERDGFATGVLNIAAYGVGMGVMLAALTVTLATARTGLLTWLRKLMQHLDQVAGAFLVLTGTYLCWYWWSAMNGSSGGLIDRVESSQSDVATWLRERGGGWLFAVLGGITVVAAAYVWFRRSGHDAPDDGDDDPGTDTPGHQPASGVGSNNG